MWTPNDMKPLSPELGHIVAFRDRYEDQLFGIVVEKDDDLGTYINGTRGMTVWCPANGKAYGIRCGNGRVVAGLTPAARLNNLLEAEAHTRNVYAYYPAWQGRLLVQCPYRFYGKAIDAVCMEARANG